MKLLNFILIIFFVNDAISQTKIDNYNGIWIAEDYYNSFEKTNNCIASKSAFDANLPVGLRLNSDEIKNGVLNIGFSSLHDHLLRPEVSEYLISKKDTIREQGSFKINITSQNNSTKFNTSKILFFNDDCECDSFLIFGNNEIILQRPKTNHFEAISIKYIRIKKDFDENYKYPNPIYYYTRSRKLVGDYILKDSLGNVVSNNLKIKDNGLISGYSLFENKYMFYSTDIYCGPSQLDEYVIISDKIKTLFQDDSFGFVFKKLSENIIYLYNTHPRTTERYPKNNKPEPIRVLGKANYQLIKQ